jgi:hypothetical protein
MTTSDDGVILNEGVEVYTHCKWCRDIRHQCTHHESIGGIKYCRLHHIRPVTCPIAGHELDEENQKPEYQTSKLLSVEEMRMALKEGKIPKKKAVMPVEHFAKVASTAIGMVVFENEQGLAQFNISVIDGFGIVQNDDGNYKVHVVVAEKSVISFDFATLDLAKEFLNEINAAIELTIARSQKIDVSEALKNVIGGM